MMKQKLDGIWIFLLKHWNYYVVQFYFIIRPLIWSDELYLKLLFKRLVGYKLNLKNPRSYNEKLQWLKLYDRRPIYTTMVDKYAVKGYVSKIIGDEYIIKNLGVWDDPSIIDWSVLPDSFVLKTTQGGASQGVVVCKNKEQLDKEGTIKRLKNALKQDLYSRLLEWPYSGVKRRIIAEEYLSDSSGEGLKDYKFYCFNGIPKILLIATGRFSVHHAYFDFFDMDGNHLPFTQCDLNNPVMPSIPSNFDKMKEIATKLSEGIPQVRIDLYSVNNSIYFGEITLFDSSGFARFDPVDWDYKWGEWLDLPQPYIN